MSFVDAGGIDIDSAAVARLVSQQFPRWADRVVTAAPFAGAANALFRLGDDLVVRLPRHPGAVAATGPLQGDGSDVRCDIRVLGAAGLVDETLATAVWESAVAAPPWHHRPAWIHGDLFPMNLLADRAGCPR